MEIRSSLKEKFIAVEKKRGDQVVRISSSSIIYLRLITSLNRLHGAVADNLINRDRPFLEVHF